MKMLLRNTVVVMVCWGLLSSCKTMSRKTARVKRKASPKVTEQLQVADNTEPGNAEKSQDVALNAPSTLVEPASKKPLPETAPLALEATAPEPTTSSLAPEAPAAARGPLNFVKVCEALKAKNFKHLAINHQVRWLCDLGGFATLQAAEASSSTAGNIREYFEEYNQTMYYGGSLSSTGSLAKASSIGKDFCGSYKGVRALMANDKNGPVSKTNPVTAALGGLNAGPESPTLTNGQCEYFQEANPAWGHRFDLLATKNYGKLATQESGRNVYWQVDAMVAPLNYSSLRQYSSLVLFWEMEGQIKGLVLTKARYTVEGSVLGVTRAKLKSNVAAMMGGYADAVK